MRWNGWTLRALLFVRVAVLNDILEGAFHAEQFGLSSG
jgi:hypothetical protein